MNENQQRWVMCIALCLTIMFGPAIADAIVGSRTQQAQLVSIAKDVAWMHDWINSASSQATNTPKR